MIHPRDVRPVNHGDLLYGEHRTSEEHETVAGEDAPSSGSNTETVTRLGLRRTARDEGFVVPLDQNRWWLSPLPAFPV